MLESLKKGFLTTAGLDGITSFPDHGADWARVHVYVLLVSCIEYDKSGRYIHLTRPAKNGLSERSASVAGGQSQ